MPTSRAVSNKKNRESDIFVSLEYLGKYFLFECHPEYQGSFRVINLSCALQRSSGGIMINGSNMPNFKCTNFPYKDEAVSSLWYNCYFYRSHVPLLRWVTGVICVFSVMGVQGTLQWRHNECDGVSNHQPHDCLLNLLFRRRSKKTSKLRVTGLCAGNWWPVNSPHKWSVTRKMFPFDDVIMRPNGSHIETIKVGLSRYSGRLHTRIQSIMARIWSGSLGLTYSFRHWGLNPRAAPEDIFKLFFKCVFWKEILSVFLFKSQVWSLFLMFKVTISHHYFG